MAVNENKVIQPVMKTKRLILRPLHITDAASIYAYASMPHVGPLAGWEPHKSINNTIEFIRYAKRKQDYGQPGVYSVVLKDSFQMIGTIEIHSYKEQKGAIGFVLNPHFWNQGYITEAAKAIIIYAFEGLHLKRLEYCHFPHNHASKRVCEKLGFQYEGTLRNKYLLFDGSVLDDVVYSLTDKDYQELSWKKSMIKDLLIDY